MPFIRTTTNCSVSKSTADKITAACGQAIPLLRGKTEDWLMVEVTGEKHLYFKGSDAPCAIAEVQIYGKGNPAELDNLTDALTKILSVSLNVPSDRIYVRYEEVAYWGWNGSNF
ncbi:MAG: hypothetical protein E7604_08590 [Ruminococcaceae bacterium]|nr:hypothetical protein [Oscillospiraceae bacterium]